MKIPTYIGAMFTINLVGGEYPDPTEHKNWPLLNQNCGNQLAHKEFDDVGETNPGEYPWAVFIHITNPDNNGITHCLGSIITNRHILTASSCFQKFGNRDIPLLSVHARAGESDFTTDPDCVDDVCAPNYVDYSIRNVHYFESTRNAEKGKDIALLTTGDEITFNDYVSPTCMEYGELLNMDYSGEQGIILSGWENNQKLKQAKVKVISPDLCEDVYELFPDAADENRASTFCAEGFPGATIHKNHADIGGPFMVERSVGGDDKPRVYLYGMLSFRAKGVRLADHGKPDVHTKVKHYMQWILDRIDAEHLDESGSLPRDIWNKEQQSAP